MSVQFADLASRVAEDGVITKEELFSLRQLGWGDGKIFREEAEAIFAINDTIIERSDEWVDFFVEAIGEFVLNGTEPRNMCSDEEARWLIGCIDRDGKIESMAELEALVCIIEKAQNAPDFLKAYVLRQVEQEVMTGVGPTRCGGELSAAHISAAECKILRRVIFASGGYGPAAVSRFDAELLFRLKDATLQDENSPLWDELFVDGVANYLKGFQLQNAQLDHARIKELQSFVADNEVRVGRFMAEMAREAPNFRRSLVWAFGKKPAGVNYTEAAAAGNLVDDFEQVWLEKMVDADGEVDDLERALLSRMIEEG